MNVPSVFERHRAVGGLREGRPRQRVVLHVVDAQEDAGRSPGRVHFDDQAAVERPRRQIGKRVRQPPSCYAVVRALGVGRLGWNGRRGSQVRRHQDKECEYNTNDRWNRKRISHDETALVSAG